MYKKPKILFAIPSLTAGGAERIVSFLAHNLDSDKFECHLIIAGYADDAAYEFDSTKTTFLNKGRILTAIPAMFLFLMRYKPDIVFSTLDLNTFFGLIAPLFYSCKFIVRPASVLSAFGKFSKGPQLYSILSKIAYKNVDFIVCQSKDMADDIVKMNNISYTKVSIINNPITQVFPLKNKSYDGDGGFTKFITVGRLSKEKGHVRLLNMLSKLSYPFHYTIVGSGPEKENIRNLVKKLNMDDKVTHIEFTAKIGEQLKAHDVYIQGSYVEGFPNAALESLVTGTPVVAFDVPGGTKEIVEHGVNGFLALNDDQFISYLHSLDNLISNPDKVRNSVLNKFSKERILQQYEKLLLNLLN